MPANDFYRKLEKAVDLSWVPALVADRHSDIGRASIDPIVIVKIELIGFLENITHERKIMREITDSLRRYVGYDIRGQGARLAAIARRTGPEPRFGEGKRWTCLERAKFRGLDKVRIQVLMVATAQNLKKYVNWTWREGQGAGAKKNEGQQAAETAAGAKLSFFSAPLQAPSPT